MDNLPQENKNCMNDDTMRDMIDRQHEIYVEIKEQINIQIEQCHMLLSKLN